jgi:hypothetical protein
MPCFLVQKFCNHFKKLQSSAYVYNLAMTIKFEFNTRIPVWRFPMPTVSMIRFKVPKPQDWHPKTSMLQTKQRKRLVEYQTVFSKVTYGKQCGIISMDITKSLHKILTIP